MRVIVRPAAEDDIGTAFDWYEAEEPGLGSDFLDEIGTTFTRIQVLPLQFPQLRGGLRRALLRRFPYSVYFIPRESEDIAVLAVLHQRRRPANWRKRLRDEGGPG